jgi:nucleoside-diphosphate-sugar epimerase
VVALTGSLGTARPAPSPRRGTRISREVVARLVADAVMVAVALLIGMVVRLVWSIEVEGRLTVDRASIAAFRDAYVTSIVCLVPIALLFSAANRLYARGRAYPVRYKALLIGRSVTLGYLAFGFLVFLFPKLTSLPRGALLMAWLFTVLFLVGARAWSSLWMALASIEGRLYPRAAPDERPGRVLVIGGAGYIGSALLPKLLDDGRRVRVLDLLLYGTEPIAGVLDHPRLEVVQADFRHVDKVVEAMQGVDTVIHLGAIVGDPACALDENLTVEVNLMATRMIAEVAKGCGVRRFVFASTCSVYGASDELLDEQSALRPVSLYACSKIACERVLRGMADEGFGPVILRFGTVYGLSGRTRFDLVINLLAAKAIVEGRITVFGGDQWRPFVHVDDVALAIFKTMSAPPELVANQIFNVGSNGQNYTIQQIGELINRAVPAADLIARGSDGDKRNYRVAFSKIQDVLGFQPRWTVEQGIQQVLDAIASGKVADYGDARYSNVRFLGESLASQTLQVENGWVHTLLNDTAEGIPAWSSSTTRAISGAGRGSSR